MPSVMEARVARARNIPYEQRDLAQAASDFYLLETLGYVKGDAIAKNRLAKLECDLSKEFSSYLDIAVGGELRYAKSMLGDDCPKELAPFMREAAGADRGTAWLAWGVIRRAWGLRALYLAQEAFELPYWRGAFGGEAWASIASVLSAYLEGRINDRIFVDRCFSLEHNSGCVFNKLWCTRKVPEVLNAHGEDDYATLLARASEEVRCLWIRREVLERSQHDPAWLGTQFPYNLDEVARWEERFGWNTMTASLTASTRTTNGSRFPRSIGAVRAASSRPGGQTTYSSPTAATGDSASTWRTVSTSTPQHGSTDRIAIGWQLEVVSKGTPTSVFTSTPDGPRPTCCRRQAHIYPS